MLKEKIKQNKEILLILLFFIILKIFFLIRFHSIIWDEAVYIGMGKSLYSLGKYGLFEILRPLILPIILGFFWKIGFNPILCGEIIAILFSLASIYVTYKIGVKIKGKITGVIAALLLAFSPLFVQNSHQILTDIPSTFFALLALYFFIDEKIIFAGISSGFAFLTRFPHGLMFVVLAFSLLLNGFWKKKFEIERVLQFVLSFFCVTSPYFIFNYFMYQADTSRFYHAILRPMIYASEIMKNYDWLYEKAYGFYLTEILKESFVVVFILVALFFIIKRKTYKESKYYTPLLALLAYIVYFSFVLSHKEYRYALSFLPIVFVFTAEGFESVYEWARERKKRIKYCIILFLVVILVAQFALMLKQDTAYIKWRLKSEPAITKEYYYFFEKNQILGTILTTDPVFAAYSDNKMIHIYNDLDYALKIFRQSKSNANAVVYTPRAFPCPPSDSLCLEKRQNLFDDIKSNFALVFEKEYDGEMYYIFTR